MITNKFLVLIYVEFYFYFLDYIDIIFHEDYFVTFIHEFVDTNDVLR